MLLRLLAVLVALVPQWASACSATDPCRIGDLGEYRVSPPQGWDGKTPIGAMVFVHGHRASAAEMMEYRELLQASQALGLMLVAPQGLNESWSAAGSPGDGRRDEVAFIGAVLDDLARRFPIDPSRLVASGFSQGASVVWDVACRGDGRFRAFMPIAGVWWRPMPTDCSAPPRPLLHIHGLADPVMPMTGRNLRDRWRQGDVREAFATMERIHACKAPPRHAKRGELDCAFDDDCARGGPVALCLHPGDHHTDPAWFRDLKDWLEAALALR